MEHQHFPPHQMESVHFNHNALFEQFWSAILENRFVKARQLLSIQNEPSKPNDIWYSAFCGILDCLEADYCQAEEHLNQAILLARSDEEMEKAMVISLYLAYLHLCSDSEPMTALYLTEALGWLEEHQVDALKEWWHPTIMNAVLKEAMARNCYPVRAKAILEGSSQYHATVENGTPLGLATDKQPRAASAKLRFLVDIPLNSTRGHDQPRIILYELISTGYLNLHEIDRLIEKLSQRAGGRSVSHTLLAAFGLYLQSKSKLEIAQSLHCSVNTVKSYITNIHSAFELKQTDYANPHERRRKLVNIAQEEGFIQ